jgi:transaldolase / glucose-6-phosphate isomerase
MGSETEFDAARRAVAELLLGQHAVERLWAGDHTLWQVEPTDCADRLGWRDEPLRLSARAVELAQSASDLHAGGVESIVWCGMGGSSLYPELIGRVPLTRRDPFPFSVLDSSHPAPIRRIIDVPAGDERLYVFASKSGGTIETRTQLEALTAAHPRARVGVVTDPDSALADLATQRGWSTWLANPDIGGRFSAFSTFGALATALVGVNVAGLAESGVAMNDRCRNNTENPAFDLAVFLAAAHAIGRDKLTLITPPTMAGFGAWVEQLVAESTGKHGQGVLPVVDEPLGSPEFYGDDRCFVAYGDVPALTALRAAGHPVFDVGPFAPTALGAELQRWMLATALIGAALGINPFDQPDVETAKSRARIALESSAPSPPSIDPATTLAMLRPGDHIVVQAFIDPAGPVAALLEEFRVRLRAKYRCAVTVGVGPRYLHSTGQLHKGGPNTGVFLQVVDVGSDDVAIPGTTFGFARLLCAQADGDHAALIEAGRRVGRCQLSALLACA